MTSFSPVHALLLLITLGGCSHPQAPALKLQCGEVMDIVSAAERAAAAPTSRWTTVDESVQSIEDGRPVVCTVLSFRRR